MKINKYFVKKTIEQTLIPYLRNAIDKYIKRGFTI